MDDEWTVDRAIELDAAIEKSRNQLVFCFTAICIPATLLVYIAVQQLPDASDIRHWTAMAAMFLAMFSAAGAICCLSDLAGRPVVLHCGLRSPAGDLFARELRRRSPLSLEQFVEQSPVARRLQLEVVRRVRTVLRDLDSLTERIRPSEPLGLILEDIDYLDIYHDLASALNLHDICLGDRRDGSIEMILEDVERAIGSTQTAASVPRFPSSSSR